ncbi:MAG: DUF6056 family protein [Ruminococcus sp.]
MGNILFIKNKKTFIPIVLIVFFSIISALCLIMQGDDFIWYYVYEIEELFSHKNPNGRYLTNEITYLMVRYPIAKYLVYSISSSLIIILTSHLMDFENKSDNLKYALFFLLFLMLPAKIYNNVMNWISGFTNYGISMIFTLAYIFFAFKIMFNREYIPSKLWLILTSVLGFFGALCVEHMTIYNIIFGIVSIVIIYKLRKRFFVSNILYLFSSVIGFAVMMSAPNYSEIVADNSDSIGIRTTEFNINDIFMQIYSKIIPYYSKQFFIIHILISVCFFCIYYNDDRSKYKVSVNRYIKICMFVIFSYSCYSLFVNCFSDLVNFDWSLKAGALETAFAFIYFTALTYISIILLKGDRCIRFLIYLISTVISVLPFVVANPVSSRCFFADGIFWILVFGEIFFSCYEKFNFFRSGEIKKIFGIFSIFIGVLICNINISNKYWNTFRINYIKEQVDDKSNIVEILKLPYTDYVYDDLNDEDIFNIHIENDFGYTDLLFRYYGIDADKYNFNYIFIGIMDYNMKK